MTATTIDVAISDVAIDGEKIHRFAGPLIFLVVAGLLVSTVSTHTAEARGCAGSATQIAAVMDEMARLQGTDRLG
jgi:hypothetical protein